MSDELAQLKDDLAKLLEAAKIYDARYKGADWKATLGIIESRIARLEAEQDDPWRLAQNCIEGWRKSDYNAHVVAFFDHLTAERDRLAARVAELEAEIKAEDDADIADAEKALAEMVQANQDMGLYNAVGNPMVDDGDIPASWPPGKPDDPILDPARVLATAVGVMGEMGFIGTADMIHRRAKDAKPYRLKGGSE